MAAKKFLKGSEEWLMFMDFWKLCQEYWEPEDSQEYWKEMSKAAMAFDEKYQAFPIANMIALGFIDSVMFKAKQMNIPFN